ncbi:MAG: adenine deaminase [Nitrospirota bacterium]|nr:adenine deaminase [Nitrospirota bacterium]
MNRISGNIVDVLNSSVYPGTIGIRNGRIAEIVKDDKKYDTYIIPGLIDSHIHIESSMLVPSEFARLAVVHGTVACLSDPHEIANVRGIDGINFMVENGKTVPFKFYFGIPSCVPATDFETSGARLDSGKIEELMKREDFKFLGEMMNIQGVLSGEPAVMAEIELAKKYGKRIDGHALGLRGEDLRKYTGTGITTDHETVDYEEGLEKLRSDMKLQIREGSAAKNFDALIGLVKDYPDDCMFCSDDKYPEDLLNGHINDLVRRAMALGIDRMSVLRCACLNPVKHYGLDVGLLQAGDHADFVVIDNFREFNILKTYINGEIVAENGRALMPETAVDIVNNFSARKKGPSDFKVKVEGDRINVIVAVDGQIITGKTVETPKISNGYAIADTDRDILKLVVVNRYRDAPPSVGFVKNFGLEKGAIASSVAHDSHNIVAVGVSDDDIHAAVNLIIENKGGLAVAYNDHRRLLPLPIAGLMSDENGCRVAGRSSEMDRLARELGSKLRAPFTTLSFMSLLVVPELKLSDKGLFDVEKFELISLFENRITLNPGG